MILKLWSETFQKEWMLSSSQPFLRSVKGNRRIYIEAKKPGNVEGYDFLTLYVNALMDIASLETEDELEIVLLKGGSIQEETGTFLSTPSHTFHATPKGARDLLNLIHDRMGDYSKSPVIPLNPGAKPIENWDGFLSKVFTAEGAPWKFFDHKSMFDRDKDLGYDPQAFTPKDYKDELIKHIEAIPFLRLDESKEDKDGK